MLRFSLALAISAFLFVPSQAAAQSASASIQVTVTQPQPVAAGANFDYVINVSNEGPDDALNITLTFPLPSGVFFQSEVAAAGWSCTNPSVGSSGTVTCTAPALAPGTVSFTITASTPPAAQPGTYSTTATITSTTPDPSDNDNSAEVDVIISTQSDYSMALTASPDPVNAGTNLTWTMTVTNNGPSTGMTASVSLPLPASTTFVSIAPPAGWSCSTPPVGTNGTVSCSLTTSLNSSSQAIFTVVSNVDSSTPSGTPLSGTATVSSPDDMFAINDSATASVQTTALADLGVTKSVAPATDFPGSALQYTIIVTNNGPSDAAAVTITDVLPAALRFTSIVAPGGWSCTTPAPGANGTVTCSLASMAAGSGGSFTLNVTIAPATAAGTNISNTAQTGSSTPDSNSANNSSTAQVVVAAPINVTASKSVNGGIHAEGSQVTYTIVLTNTGSIAQGDNPGNELTDVLPSSLTLTSATASSGTAVANAGTNTVTWNGSIAGGGTVTIAIQALVKYGTNGSTISNQATVSYDSDANGTNDASRGSDDPSTIAPNDPTSFQVVGSVPALSQMMLVLLAAALAVMSLIVTRK
jgi:uncharacterized repeat protein (TIGR01451 family)